MAEQTTLLKVVGMSCDHCKRAVTQALARVPGVSGVEVSLEKGTATVRHDPARATMDALRHAVQEEGYDVAG